MMYLSRIFDIMTNILTSWRVFDDMTFDVFLTSWRTFWHHDIFLTSCRVLPTLWCHDVFLTSWRTFWRHEELFGVMTCFFYVMTNIGRHDVFLTSWRTCWVSWRVFEVMTIFLSSWHISKVMTNILASWRIYWLNEETLFVRKRQIILICIFILTRALRD